MLSRQEETGFMSFEPQLVEVPDQRSSQATLLGRAPFWKRESTTVRRKQTARGQSKNPSPSREGEGHIEYPP
jgi:hypothetical protein